MTKNWKNYSDTRFEALQSLSKGEFELLLTEFQPIVEKYFRYHTLQGKPRVLPARSEARNSSLMGSGEKLFFILYFLKNNPLQESIGAFFEMSQGKVSQWVKLLLPLLSQSLSKLKFVPTQRSEELYRLLESKGEEYIVLQDATVRDIERSTDWEVQKEYYDGKHKSHTIKNHLVTNTDNQVLYVSPSYQGSIHDKKLIEEEGLIFPSNVILMHDLGYQGFNPKDVEVIMPKKRKKGEALSNLDKLLNQIISSIRVKVEHVIEKIKILRVLRDKIRIKGWQKRHEVFLIGCALNNLRVKSRNLNYNS